MASAKTTEIFNFSAQQIFDVIKDFESYSDFLSEVTESKIVEDLGPNKKIVKLTVSMIKDFSYQIVTTLDDSNDKAQSIKWVFHSGDVFKSNSGSWILKSISENQTQVTYEVEADFKIFVPSMIAKKMISVSLPKMMQTYKDRIQQINSTSSSAASSTVSTKLKKK